MRQAARTYLETQVTTTSQGQVLIMLYDGAIKFLHQAKERIQAKDFAGKGKLISSAIDVINELASSLNAEKGGDLAANLNQLYFYCNKRLFMANSRMDTVPIDEVIKILGGIRSAYAQIIDTPEAVAAMAKAPPPGSKGPRAPLGLQLAQPGAPVPAARVRNAYATQNAAVDPERQHAPAPPPETPLPASASEEAAPVAPVAPAAPVAPVAPVVPVAPETELPLAEAVPDKAPSAMPDLDFGFPEPPPSLAPGKRLAASTLYRKFAS